MKLSDLVNYRNKIEKISTAGLQRTVSDELDSIMHVIDNQQIKIGTCSEQLTQSLIEIEKKFFSFEKILKQLKGQIDDLISAGEKPWFQKSYEVYETGMHERTEDILEKLPGISKDTELILLSRLMNYVDWRYPAMIIRPGRESFIDSMVGYDPLYLLDTNYDLLRPAIEKFPTQYQRRVRPYVIKENGAPTFLGKIPDGQFGMCLVYGFFEYKPFEIIKKYLSEIYDKLQPGGILIMTYNDCDRATAVALVEKGYACYTPGYLIQDLAKIIGFKQIFTWNDGGSSSWLELRKPGELKSLRGGQTLAKVVAKPK
jgi:hypothetical protein